MLRVRVTDAACVWQPLRIYGGLAALCGTDPMDAVAAHALCRPRILFSEQQDAVLALLVLAELIRSERGVEAAHERGIGMTAGAEVGNPAPIAVALILLRPALGDRFCHRLVFRRPAVAAGAGKAAAEMGVADELAQIEERI